MLSLSVLLQFSILVQICVTWFYWRFVCKRLNKGLGGGPGVISAAFMLMVVRRVFGFAVLQGVEFGAFFIAVNTTLPLVISLLFGTGFYLMVRSIAKQENLASIFRVSIKGLNGEESHGETEKVKDERSG